MTAPLDPHNPGGDRDFRQLTDAFDRLIAPSPSFADALKQRLKEESAMHHAPTATGTVPSTPISNRTARTAAQPIPRRRWLDMAIAAVLIVGMLASTFWYADVRIGGDGPGDPEPTRYAAQPLSSVSTPEAENESAVTSDPGNTLSFPAGFDPESEHDVVPLGDVGPDSAQHAAISGDILVVSGTTPEWTNLDNPGLTAIDLTTRNVVWSSELHPLRDFIASGSRVFGAFAETGRSDYAMTSISIETGEVLWAGPPLMDNSGIDAVSPVQPMFLSDLS